MALYRYIKRQPVEFAVKSSKKSKSKFLPLILVVLGLLFVGNAAYPIITYQLLVAPRFARTFLSPTSEAEIAQSFAFPQAMGTEIDLVDFTNAENWFPQSTSDFSQAEGFYNLSVPKLGISNAVVIVGSQDLKKSLVQYPGTALPGRFGNTVIFGHSVLPQFFNPKKYITIFSTLPTLKPKDEILIEHNQVRYRYLIEKMIEVPPTDVSILAQRYDDSYLTLITCVPPGTYLRRLIVRARLVKV